MSTKPPDANQQVLTNDQYKKEFDRIYGLIHRGKNVQMRTWLETTDFFTAPASTHYHEAYEGGLLEHSVTCFYKLEVLRSQYPELDISDESMALCALGHDFCKVNFYRTAWKNTKDEAGKWVKTPFYTVDDAFPMGHGEKSVYLIERFIRLKPEEAVAIRWHMGGFDSACRGGDYACGKAFEKYPLAVLLHIADLQATYLKINGAAKNQ